MSDAETDRRLCECLDSMGPWIERLKAKRRYTAEFMAEFLWME